MGAAKRWNVAAEEMGLPGRPKKTCAVGGPPLRGICPKTSGLPGWILTPVKWKMAPRRARAGSTRSNLPAETPPEMRSMSACMAFASAASRALAVSAAVGRTMGSPPALAKSAASMGAFELRILPGPGVARTGTSSSPVVRMATRGRM